MANRQQRGNREPKKPKKERSKADRPATLTGFFDKARERTTGRDIGPR